MLEIKTARLTLRPLEPCDLETTHAYAGDAANTEYMVHLPNRAKQETAQFLRKAIAEWGKDRPQSYEFAVVLGKKHIGAVSIYLDDSGEACELGWIIHRDFQGNGYATEAAKAVLDFAFDRLNVKKVCAHCDHRNEPSYRVMQKIGLALEREDGLRRYKGSDEDVPERMCSVTADERARCASVNGIRT